jgi:PilZ domain
MSSVEHRCGIRHATDVAVLLSTPNGLVGKGVLCQISVSGALIRSSLPLWPGMNVRVRFAPAQRQGSLRSGLTGAVVRCSEDGFAMEWDEFAVDATRMLVRQGSAAQTGADVLGAATDSATHGAARDQGGRESSADTR